METAVIQQPAMANNPASAKKKKALLIGAGVAVVAVGGYFFVWPILKSKFSKNTSSSAGSSTSTIPQPSDFTPAAKPVTSSAAKRTDNFPLKRGSLGANVKALQSALIAKGAKITADGDFGPLTESALKAQGLPASVDETLFNVLVQGSGGDPASLGKSLYNAIKAKNFSETISLLNKITSTQQYSSVSNEFKKLYLNTLVNGALSSFTDSSHKQQIQLAFTKMGLKYNGTTWSLTGLSGMPLITTATTHVWPDPNTAIEVPANMVLGDELEQRGQYTAFNNNGRVLLVRSTDVRYF